MSETPPLIAAAQSIDPDIDLVSAAADTGLAHLPLDQLTASADLVWLTLAAVRAGLGLPADPLSARGWLRFGEKVDPSDAALGDIVIVTVKDEQVAGILSGDHRGLQVQIGPNEVLKSPRTRLVAARRPIVLPAD